MGFESQELLKLLIRKSPTGKKGGGLLMIQKPHLVVLDLMCSLHRLSSFNGTVVELYNVLMEQVRIWLIEHKTPIVWVSIDKGVPAFKTRKTYNQSAEAKEKAAKPYPLHTTVDEYGRLIFTQPVYDHASGRVQFKVTGHSDTVDVGRLLRSERRLRRCIFDRMFRDIARGETKNVPAGCKLIISYSLDKALSPVVITSTGHAAGVSQYYNDLLEADWDMQRAISVMSKEMPARASTLVCSVDGDMLGILGYGIARMKRTGSAMGPLYFYNMNQTANGRTIEMGDFVDGLLCEHSMTVAGLLLLLFLCGNDYVRKADLTAGIGPEYIWDAIVSIQRHPTKLATEKSTTPFEPTPDEFKAAGGSYESFAVKGGAPRAVPHQFAHVLSLCRVMSNSSQFYKVVSHVYAICAACKTRKTPGAASSITDNEISDQMGKFEEKLSGLYLKKKKKELGADVVEELGIEKDLESDQGAVLASDKKMVIERCRLLMRTALREWMGAVELDLT